MMNRQIAVALLALPLSALPIGAATLLSQPATAAESRLPVAVRQAPTVVAQRYDNNGRDQNNDRREEARREEARREEARREEARRDRRVWIPGHWESGFLGIGRKWVEGHWETR